VTADNAATRSTPAGAGAATWADLKVAVNAMCLWRPITGIGQYTLNIAREWARMGMPRAEYFYGVGWSPLAGPRQAQAMGAIKRIVKAIFPRPYGVATALLQRSFDARSGPFDVYWEPNFLAYRYDGCPLVAVVHDLSHVRYPQMHPSQRVRDLDERLPATLERAAHILTDSHFQRQEIIDCFGVAPERVTAVHLGVSESFHPRDAAQCRAALDAHGLTYRGYLLAVGTLEPRKNLDMVLRAYACLPQALRERLPLAIAGVTGWNTETLQPQLRALARSGSIRRLGFVSDEDLPVLYSAARVFVYPSLYEGFGLPPLEAMASGVPVIASNVSSLPEVVGDAGVQIEPSDEGALCEAIRALHDDPDAWQRRSQAGLERARLFTWGRTATSVAEVLASAARR
jgi:glycosyltransferase involved in cell wall biosynthesis